MKSPEATIPSCVPVAEGWAWEKLDLDCPEKVSEICRHLAAYERTLPKWFQALSKIWGDGPTRKAWREFLLRMDFVYVLKCDSKPALCVCFQWDERFNKGEREIHFGVCHKRLERSLIVQALTVLKEALFASGFTVFSGWVASRNFGLFKITEEVGFSYTGLRMVAGQLRRRPVRWELIQICRPHKV